MHIPDNYLSPATCAAMGAIMVPVWARAARKVRQEASRTRIPLLGIGAAFSFLVMMFNVPLPGGTTGHAVGGTLLAVILGPWSACVAVTVSLLVQALVFGDGGILAFAANSFNMAFVLPFAGYFLYRVVSARIRGERGQLIAVAVGSYAGLNLAALAAAIEFGIQPLLFRTASGLPRFCPYPLSVSIPAMVLPHLAVAGVVEAVFTVAVVSFLRKVSPELARQGAQVRMGPVLSLLGALVLLTPVGLLAAGTAWGEWGVEEIGRVAAAGRPLGFIPEGMRGGFSFSALFPDYAVRGVPGIVGYVLSAVIGAAILLIVFKLLSLLKKKERSGARG